MSSVFLIDAHVSVYRDLRIAVNDELLRALNLVMSVSGHYVLKISAEPDKRESATGGVGEAGREC